jgi:Zinc knuckle
MRMYPQETSFAFRKRVEDYQLERTSVGLEEIPAEELVIGVLNRLDMSRYASLVRDYLDNERRGIAALPELPSTLWKEIKDTQVVRFRGAGPAHLQAVYLSRVDDPENKGRGRGRGGRGGRGRGGRGGRGRGPYAPTSTAEKGEVPDSIKRADITCWTCGKKGHRSNTCPTRQTQSQVHFADSEEAQIYLTSIQNFHPSNEESIPETAEPAELVSNMATTVLLSKAKDLPTNVVMLDTQSAVHLMSNEALMTDITPTSSPIVIQGISKVMFLTSALPVISALIWPLTSSAITSSNKHTTFITTKLQTPS